MIYTFRQNVYTWIPQKISQNLTIKILGTMILKHDKSILKQRKENFQKAFLNKGGGNGRWEKNEK